jgi:hypothetical protein
MNIESLYNKTNIESSEHIPLTKISTLLTAPLKYSIFQNNELNQKYSEVINNTDKIFKFLPDTIQNLQHYISDALLLDHKRIKEVSDGTKALINGISPLLIGFFGAGALLYNSVDFFKQKYEELFAPSAVEVDLSEAARNPFVPEKGLGYISRKHESGGNVGQISMDRDGYRSYGAYQFWSKRGNSLDGFLNSLRKSNLPQYNKLLSLTPNTPEFDAEWKRLSKERPQEFFALQHYYNVNANYKPMVNTLDKIGINVSNRGPAIQEAVLSTVTQYGPGGAKQVFREAFAGVDVSKLSDKEFIDRLYLYKFNTVGRWFTSSDYNTQKSVRLRFLDEMKDLGGADLTKYKKKVEKENLQTINASPTNTKVEEQKTQTNMIPSKKPFKPINNTKVEEQKTQASSKEQFKPVHNAKTEKPKSQTPSRGLSKTEQDISESTDKFSFYNMEQNPQNVKLFSNSDPSPINSTQAKNAQASLNRNGWKYYG